MKKQACNRHDLTTGETLALEIARLFPDEFRVWGERVSVKENAGTERTRREVSADLAEMYAAADAERAESRNKRQAMKDKASKPQKAKASGEAIRMAQTGRTGRDSHKQNP